MLAAGQEPEFPLDFAVRIISDDKRLNNNKNKNTSQSRNVFINIVINGDGSKGI